MNYINAKTMYHLSSKRNIMTPLAELPLVTIGIPTYNGGVAVKRAVASIQAQSYPNLEIIISDNASTDNDTAVICQQLKNRYPYIRYYRQPGNIGMHGNFDFLLQQAHGKYFMWLADDDTLAEKVLSRYVDFLESNVSYSVISGTIEYWNDDRVCDYEHGFNLYYNSPVLRVLLYYFKVVHGAMYHGLMRTLPAKQIDTRRVIGNDWHFVANLAFIGKISNPVYIGYRKRFGGASRNFRNYAEAIGETAFAGKYPHLKIAMDAYREVMYRSSVFATLAFYKRFTLALCVFAAVLLSFGITLYPFILGGRIKRYFWSNVLKPIFSKETVVDRG